MVEKKNKSRFLPAAGVILLLAAVCLGGCSFGKDLEQENAYRDEGIAMLKNGEYAEAAEKFDQALEIAGDDRSELEKDITLYKAEALRKADDQEEALAIYDELLAEDSTDSELYYLRGMAILEEGRPDQADIEFQRAMQNAPADYTLAFAIWQELSDAGKQDLADAYLRLILDMEGDSDEDLCRKGYVCYLLGDISQAQDYLGKAVEAGSEQAGLYQGILYAAEGDSDKAGELFEQYFNEHQDDAQAVLDVAAAAAEGGLYEDAVSYYKAAKSIEGVDRQAADKGLIAAYEGIGDYETADTLLKEYLENWPDDQAAQKEKTFVQTRR